MVKTILLLTLTYIVSATKSSNNVGYNKLINSAELAISDSNFSKATQIYYGIFTDANQYMFAKDVWNYALSSILENDTQTTKKCIIDLIEKDFELEKINSNAYLKPVLRQIEVENIRKKVSNQVLYDLIDSLHTMDQKYRMFDSMYIKYKNEINLIDSSNAVILKKMFDAQGFPSEMEVGSTQLFNLKILLAHQNFGIKRQFDFTEYVSDGLHKNKIEANYGMNLIMRLSGKDPYCNDCEVVKLSYSTLNSQLLEEKDKMAETKNFILGHYKQYDTTINEANKRRKEIGVASVSESRKKALFALSKPDFGFIFFNLSHNVFTDKKQYEWFLKDFIIIHQ